MDDEDEADSSAAPRDPRWGLCEAYGCPLPGTVGRAGKWLCCCHFETDVGANDAVTRIIRRHFAVYRAVCDVHRGLGSERWPHVWREVQQRLIESGYADLLPDGRDASPYRPGRLNVPQWLARLERFLLDAVRVGLRGLAAEAEAAAGSGAPMRPQPSGRDCIARMRTTLAPLAKREASARWAFELLDRIAAKPDTVPRSDAIRVALDAICSSAGRAYVANATDEQRARWRAVLEVLDGVLADLLPSREPGEDDEETPQDATT